MTAYIRDSITQMADGRLRDVRRYVLTQPIVAESARTLRALSGGYRESVVVWTGTHQGETAVVQRIVVPYQRASARHFDVPLRERLRLVTQLATRGETLLVQLHTHPGAAFHSAIDDRLALPQHTGAISIVVADFAATWDGDSATHVSQSAPRRGCVEGTQRGGRVNAI